MKKSQKIITAVLCAAMAVPFLAQVGTISASASSADAPYNINMGIGSNDSEVRFTWISESDVPGKLEIAKTSDIKNGNFPTGSQKNASIATVTATEGYLDNSVNTNTNRTIGEFKDADGNALENEYSNKVTVSGLEAGVSYTYRVESGDEWSKEYTFTQKDTANGFSFAAFGDPQIGASGNVENDQKGWAATLKKVTSKYPNLNFLFSMGDQVNDYDHLYKEQNEYKSFFNPDSTEDYLQTNLLTEFSGNHDFQMGKYYSYHYNQPNLSSLGQTVTNNVADNNGDFYFKYGNTLFINLEANNFYDVSAHDAFLKQATDANKDATWKVVSFHQAPYSEANHDGASTSDDDVMFIRNNWTKLMDKYDVDIVLNGHDHYYTRSYQMLGGTPVSTVKTNSVTDPEGTVYFTLDSASGSKFYKYNTTADHSFSAFGWQNNQPTYTYAKVSGDSFTLETYNTTTDEMIDTYTIKKTAKSTAINDTDSGNTTVSNPNNTSSEESNPKTGDNTTFVLTIVLGAAFILIVAGSIIAKKATGKRA